MNHYDLRNSPSSDRLREGSRSFAELHLISLISPKANLISIPSRRQHLSFQITDAAVKGIRRDFDILCRRVSSMDEGAALAAACSFGDGGSGLDSESAPSRTLAPHSPSEREREGEREESKLSLLLLLSFSSGRKAWDFMFYFDFCLLLGTQNRGGTKGCHFDRFHIRVLHLGQCIRQPSSRLASSNVGLGSSPKNVPIDTLEKHSLATREERGN